MGRTTNVVKRAGSSIWYARISIPKRHQEAFGKREHWQSLGTPNHQEAKRRVLSVQSEWLNKIAAADTALEAAKAKRPLSEAELQHAVWDHFQDVLRSDEHRRNEAPTKEMLDVIWRADVEENGGIPDVETFRILDGIEGEAQVDAEQRRKQLATLKAEQKSGSTSQIRPVLNEFVQRRQLAIEPHSKDERTLARYLQRARIDGLQHTLKRDDGDFSIAPADPVVKPPSIPLSAAAKPGETVMELFEVYAKENPNRARPDTLNQARVKVKVFADFVGKHFSARKITKEEVRQWKALLKDYPVKAAEIGAFKGLLLRQIVETNKKLGKPTISDKTVNQYITALSAYCGWLMSQGYLESVPTYGMLLNVDKETRVVGPYQTEHLNKIFSSPLFTGCVSLNRITNAVKPGPTLVRDHHFWVPLVALFTGARVNEICQLLTADIMQVKGHWVFNITDEGDGDKQIKNQNSKRVVPIHTTLIELGLLNYHKAQQNAEQQWLFPEIEPDSRGRRGGHFSDFYGKYIEQIGVKVDRRLNFHSFRHTMMDALRDAGFMDHEIAVIVGHEKRTTTSGYGTVKQGNIETRVKIINALQYEGLDLTHLTAK